MKKIYPGNFLSLCFFLFLVLSIKTFAQLPPIVTSINGPYATCAYLAKTYSTSASNSPTSYSWSVLGPPNGTAILTTPLSATTSIYFPYVYNQQNTYTVYVNAKNNGGTSATTSLVVTVFETPFVTFSGSHNLCQGSSTNLSASATNLSASSTITYSWMPSTGLNTTNGYSVISNPNSTINYTVLVTKGICTSTANTTIYVTKCLTGINSIESQETMLLSVYPNPNNGTFFIKSDKNELAVILNEIGQTVRSFNLEAGTEATISGLPGGLYFVVTATMRKKIVITN